MRMQRRSIPNLINGGIPDEIKPNKVLKCLNGVIEIPEQFLQLTNKLRETPDQFQTPKSSL